MPHTREASDTPEPAGGWRERQAGNVALTDRGLLRAVLALAVALFGLFLIWRFLAVIASAVLVLLVALLFAVALSGPVEWLHRRKVPRMVASVLIVLGILASLGLSGYLFMPVLTEQASQLVSALPFASSQLGEWVERATSWIGLTVGGGDSGPSLSTLVTWGQQLAGGALGLFGSLASFIFGLLVIVFIPLYLTASPEPAVGWVVRLFPPASRPRTRAVLSEVRSNLLNWLKGRLISMAIVGVLSIGALYLIGVPGALFLGLFTGLIEFVPYFGPVIAALPPLLLALTGEPMDALWVVLAYVAIQQIEGNLITPLVVRGTTSLHPVVVIAAVTASGAAFGFLGALLAIPAAVVVKVLIEELWFRRLEKGPETPESPD